MSDIWYSLIVEPEVISVKSSDFTLYFLFEKSQCVEVFLVGVSWSTFSTRDCRDVSLVVHICIIYISQVQVWI